MRKQIPLLVGLLLMSAFLAQSSLAGEKDGNPPSSSPPSLTSKFKMHPTPYVKRGMTSYSVNVGAAASADVRTNVGAPLRFDPSPWVAIRSSFEICQGLDWMFAIEPEFSYYQPNARIQGILGIAGFDARADLDVFNGALSAVGKWNFARDWQLYFGAGPVLSHMEASNARFVRNGVNLATASAEDTRLGCQGLLGFKYFLADHWAISLENRFIRVDDVTLVFPTVTVIAPLESYVTSVGLSYQF